MVTTFREKTQNIKSITRFIFLIAGVTVPCSRKQSTASLRTTEAKYVASGNKMIKEAG